MYCIKCGKETKNGEKFCNDCISNSISADAQKQENEVKNKDTQIEKNPEDEKKANLLCILSLLCTYASGFVSHVIGNASPTNISNSISYITSALPTIGLILMIVARVNYPNNKFAKILMWIYIINIVIMIIAFVLVYIWCINAAQDCGSMG